MFTATILLTGVILGVILSQIVREFKKTYTDEVLDIKDMYGELDNKLKGQAYFIRRTYSDGRIKMRMEKLEG